MCSSARSIGTGSPSAFARRHEASQLHLVVERPARPSRLGASLAAGLELAPRPAHGRAARHDARTRGRDSRSGPTCSWGAADCRGGTCCRRWSRGGSRRRSRCSRRSPPAGAAPPRPSAPGAGRPAGDWRGGPVSRRRAARSPVRRSSDPAARDRGPSGVQRGRGTGLRRPLGETGEAALVVARGDVEDLVADGDPDAGAARSSSSRRRKTPNGRF